VESNSIIGGGQTAISLSLLSLYRLFVLLHNWR